MARVRWIKAGAEWDGRVAFCGEAREIEEANGGQPHPFCQNRRDGWGTQICPGACVLAARRTATRQLSDRAGSGQLRAGAWSHLIALRHGADSPLLMGVCSHTATRCRATAQRLGPLSWGSGGATGGISAGVSQ